MGKMPPIWAILLIGAVLAACLIVPVALYWRRRTRTLAAAGGPRVRFDPLDPDGQEYRQVDDRRPRRGELTTAGHDKIEIRRPVMASESTSSLLSWGMVVSCLASYTFVIFRGPKRSGKTVLAHFAATERAKAGERVIVFDPDARPGMWPGCEVYGAGDDWDGMIAMMTTVAALITGRRKSRTQGNRVFERLTVVFSEGADIMKYAKGHARPLFDSMARRGDKLGITFFLDVQDTQAGTLDLDGATHLLHNADMVISVRKDAAGDRWGSIGPGLECAIPMLPDPEALADRWAADRRLVLVSRVEAPSALETAQDTSIGGDTSIAAPAAPSGPQDAPEPETKAAERQALALARWAAGKPLSQNDIAALLGGNRNDQLSRLKAIKANAGGE